VGAGLARAIAPTNPTASNVLVTNMGCLLFLFVAVIQHATVSAGSNGTPTGLTAVHRLHELRSRACKPRQGWPSISSSMTSSFMASIGRDLLAMGA
jgi:hypothetical protein